MTREQFIRFVVKPLVFIVCLLPFAQLAWNTVNNNLGANPVETITHFTGDWALRFLLITLSMTPIRILTGYGQVLRFRRMLGLYAFFYTLLHFVTYVWLDRELDMSTVLTDIVKRPYITVGFTAFVLLIPLAVTSTRGWIRRLGKRWVQLHKLVYIIATLGVLHYLWLVKADIREPVIYGAILMALLIIRAWNERRKRLST
jgi:sulfoxide reductase heme-binding subunit YedZ